MNSRPEAPAESEARRVVTFTLSEKVYALLLDSVVQIVPMVALTALPGMPQALAGIMNFRGRSIPVIDLRCYLGLPPIAPGLYTPIVIVRAPGSSGQMVGLMVDEVRDVVEVLQAGSSQIADLLPSGLGALPTLSEIVRISGRSVLLLALEHLLSTAPAFTTVELGTVTAMTEEVGL